MKNVCSVAKSDVFVLALLFFKESRKHFTVLKQNLIWIVFGSHNKKDLDSRKRQYVQL